jgi:hypothetical protein
VFPPRSLASSFASRVFRFLRWVLHWVPSLFAYCFGAAFPGFPGRVRSRLSFSPFASPSCRLLPQPSSGRSTLIVPVLPQVPRAYSRSSHVSRLPAFYRPPPASVFGCQGASTSIMSIIPCIIVLCQMFYRLFRYALYACSLCHTWVTRFGYFTIKYCFMFSHSQVHDIVKVVGNRIGSLICVELALLLGIIIICVGDLKVIY